MSSPGISVALLYETRECGEHLRETLGTLGAPIVYEATARALDRDALQRSHANVVVVNLDAGDGPELDQVYDLLDDARYRVVFNESDVSSSLSGWDQARWARHLAAKIFGAVDIDPPRPADAQAVPTREAASPSQVVLPPAVAAAPLLEGSRDDAAAAPAIVAPLPAVAPETDFDFADLDALIEVPVAAPSALAATVFDATLVDGASLATPMLDAAPLAPPPSALNAVEAVEFDASPLSYELAPGAADEPFEALPELSAFDLAAVPTDATAPDGVPHVPDDDFALDFDFDAELPTVAAETETPAVPSAPLDWTLEEVAELPDPADLAPDPAPVAAAPASFGIEKMSAAEFLAPAEGAAAAPALPPVSELALELIPLEEAVAPTAADAVVHEAWLDPDAAKVRRVWVLGASIGGPESVREFLAAFPRDYPALFVLAQHLGDEFVGMMTQQLAKVTALTVRTPTHGERVGHGEVIVVPNSHRLQVDAQGVVVLERLSGERPFNPSIDRVLQDVADRFGAAAGAIVFSGMTHDAIEGCRELAAKGGTVYAQRPDTCVVSTMVDGVCEAGVVSFLGSPRELADKLLAARD